MTDLDLLVIGNGFDLACGLKTSYNDFHNALVASIRCDINKPLKKYDIFKDVNLKGEKVNEFINTCQE